MEATNGTEIAVVTVPKTVPSASPKAFTTELFNHWRIGKADADNGVLFLISVGDRRVEEVQDCLSLDIANLRQSAVPFCSHQESV